VTEHKSISPPASPFHHSSDVCHYAAPFYTYAVCNVIALLAHILTSDFRFWLHQKRRVFTHEIIYFEAAVLYPAVSDPHKHSRTTVFNTIPSLPFPFCSFLAVFTHIHSRCSIQILFFACKSLTFILSLHVTNVFPHFPSPTDFAFVCCLAPNTFKLPSVRSSGC
jgi:hypothetical protein